MHADERPREENAAAEAGAEAAQKKRGVLGKMKDRVAGLFAKKK